MTVLPDADGADPEGADPEGADPDVVELVDPRGRAVGVAGKVDAHRPPGLLHRALSVFLFDATGSIVVQRRAGSKALFSGLWSNSCCTHPAPGEGVVAGAARRVPEELGTQATALAEVGSFTYRALDARTGLVEHELDHLLVGGVAGPLDPNPDEVADVRSLPLDELADELARDPGSFTPWLPPALALLRARLPRRDPRTATAPEDDR